eukprot:5849466-Amphidinium_carterae.2
MYDCHFTLLPTLTIHNPKTAQHYDCLSARLSASQGVCMSNCTIHLGHRITDTVKRLGLANTTRNEDNLSRAHKHEQKTTLHEVRML